jgi:hypothetical protein
MVQNREESLLTAVRNGEIKGSIEANKAANRMGEYLKAHYIRTRTEAAAKLLLYGRVASGEPT